jgi:hypothetical protein
MSEEEMIRVSIEVFERNKHLLARDDDCAVWQVISRGADQFSKGRPVAATVTVFCVPIAYHSFAREYVEGYILVTPSIRRTPPQSLEAKAKITNKMNHTMAAFEAKQVNSRATPLMLDLDGNISENKLLLLDRPDCAWWSHALDALFHGGQIGDARRRRQFHKAPEELTRGRSSAPDSCRSAEMQTTGIPEGRQNGEANNGG